MKPTVLLVSFSLPFLSLGCSVPKYESTFPSYRQAIVRGQLKEALASYEYQAREAEKSAQGSLFPQYYWREAVQTYGLAGNAARRAGQLQKAITYGEKALEIAEKSKDPGSLFRAIDTLVPIYRQVRNFDKARELIEKGIAVVKTLPPNTDPRTFWEGAFYEQLGDDLVRRREYEKAIDLLSLSVNLQQRYLASVFWQNYSVGRNPVWLNENRTDLLLRLTNLGNAYRRAGRLKESAGQYQLAFDHIKEWGLKYPWEDRLYADMGDVYFEQQNFPQALENFQKVLALGESRQIAGDIRRAT